MFSLSQAGYVDAKHALNLISYMSKELDYLPWNVLINSRVSYFFDMLESTEYFGEFRSYVAGLITPYYSKVGWTDEQETKVEWPDRFDLFFFQTLQFLIEFLKEN